MKVLFPILILIAFASCRTMRKNSQSHTTKSDSAAAIVKHETKSSIDKTVKVEESTGSKSGTIKIVLEFGDKKIQTQISTDSLLSTLPATSSSPTRPLQSHGQHSSLRDLFTNPNLTKATIDSDFDIITNSKTTTLADKKDSSTSKQAQKTQVSKEENTKTATKNVKGMSFSFSLAFWIIVALILVILFFYFKTRIMKFIKNFIARLLMLMLLSFAFSCNNPSDEISGTVTQWDGQYEVLPGADKPTQVFVDYVLIDPTWEQSFYYSFKTGYGVSLTFAIAMLIIAAICFYRVAKQRTKSRIENGISIALIGIGIIGFLAFGFSQPATVRWNNTKKIEKKYYESHKDNLPDLWDELYEKGLVGAGHD